MRIYDGRIFLHIVTKFSYRIFFSAFSTAILIFFVFLLPISNRFRYLDHLVANRMAPSMCPDPCGTRWGSRLQAILNHISAYFWRIFGVYAVRMFFKKCHIKLTPKLSAALPYRNGALHCGVVRAVWLLSK